METIDQFKKYKKELFTFMTAEKIVTTLVKNQMQKAKVIGKKK